MGSFERTNRERRDAVRPWEKREQTVRAVTTTAVLGSAAIVLLLGVPSGCSDDAESEPGATTTASTTTTIGTGGTTTTTTVVQGGSGGQGGGTFTCPEGGFPPHTPTPEQIGFDALHPIPSGEQILFNDWQLPDSVYSLSLDGQTATEIFRVYRVWSLGVANGADKLAFACGDPQQLEHYGIAMGDAIQHTWLYDFETESITLLADGRINDECHEFAADDSSIYVCRRYDWQCDEAWGVVGKGYRIGRIELEGGAFSFITEESASFLDLYPQPNADESEMLFLRVTWEGNSQSRAIMQMDLPDGVPASVRANANAPLRSPDGLRYLYVDYQQNGWLFGSDLDGTNEVLVVQKSVSSVRFSPDGTRVAYLTWDGSQGCSHIETVAVDGSEAQAPNRLRDCGASGEFITDLAWIDRP